MRTRAEIDAAHNWARSPGGYMSECLLMTSESDPNPEPLFTFVAPGPELTDGRVTLRLHRYAIIPSEEYERLKKLAGESYQFGSATMGASK